MDLGPGRHLGRQTGEESAQDGRRSFYFQVDAAGVVAHPTGETQLTGQAVDEGPEPHPLDGASDLQA
jgi:hypothetical protein